jgi:hypothetical protein
MAGVHDSATPLPFSMKALKKALIGIAMSADESGRVLRRFVRAQQRICSISCRLVNIDILVIQLC